MIVLSLQMPHYALSEKQTGICITRLQKSWNTAHECYGYFWSLTVMVVKCCMEKSCVKIQKIPLQYTVEKKITADDFKQHKGANNDRINIFEISYYYKATVSYLIRIFRRSLDDQQD